MVSSHCTALGIPRLSLLWTAFLIRPCNPSLTLLLTDLTASSTQSFHGTLYWILLSIISATKITHYFSWPHKVYLKKRKQRAHMYIAFAAVVVWGIEHVSSWQANWHWSRSSIRRLASVMPFLHRSPNGPQEQPPTWYLSTGLCHKRDHLSNTNTFQWKWLEHVRIFAFPPFGQTNMSWLLKGLNASLIKWYRIIMNYIYTYSYIYISPQKPLRLNLMWQWASRPPRWPQLGLACFDRSTAFRPQTHR